MKDIVVGARFGRWVVLESGRRPRVLCRCDCGQERLVGVDNLRRSLSTSCGCSKRMELAGSVIGRWTVESCAGKDRWGSILWNVLCACGQRRIVAGSQLVTGKSTSCGCIAAEAAQERFAHAREAGLSKGTGFGMLWNRYRHNAKKRKRIWDLTEDQFEKLTSSECEYCGAPPGQISRNKRCGVHYVYNGVDRIDNGKGYSIDNVVSCCKSCNLMKGRMSREEFLDVVRRISSKIHWTRLHQVRHCSTVLTLRGTS